MLRHVRHYDMLTLGNYCHGNVQMSEMSERTQTQYFDVFLISAEDGPGRVYESP